MKIRRILGTLAAAFFGVACSAAIFGSMSLVSSAATDVAINSTNFPDDIFRTYVSTNFDTDGNGMLSQSEIDSVTTVDVRGTSSANGGITSLKGIEYLTNVTIIRCDFNNLTSLDVTKNTSLTFLNCEANKISAIDVSKNSALVSLVCDANELTTLNVTKNTKLQRLVCGNNKLTSLNVSYNCALKDLWFGNASYLNDYQCQNLNSITEIDVSKNTALETLYCYNNPLKALDVSNNQSLRSLHCFNCNLTSLDLSKNTNLTWLSSSENKFSIPKNAPTFDLSELTQYGFDPKKASNWKNCTYDSATNTLKNITGNVTYNYDIGSSLTASAGDNTLFTLVRDGEASTDDPIEDPVEEDLGIEINDVNFPDPVFRKYVADNFDKNSNGWLYYNELNAITEVDVSGINQNYGGVSSLKGIEFFTKLVTLKCRYNTITSLDVSKNTALVTLDFAVNKISAIDLTKNTALVNLDCCGNEITALNISKNTKLQQLNCSNNKLTALNVSNNPALQILDFGNYGALGSYPLPNSNSITKIDVRKNTKLFKLSCIGNGISELNLSYNTLLNTLLCQNNNIAKLDLSKNTALVHLFCNDNPLKALDVSNNKSLVTLQCHKCELTSLDLTKNTNLKILSNYNNKYSIPSNAFLFKLSELTQYGFDPKKASNWKNCDYDASTNMLINITGDVTFNYDIGSNLTTVINNGDNTLFTLVRDGEPDQDLGIEINDVNFPDPVFRKYVADNFDKNSNGWLYYDELYAVKKIDVSGTAALNNEITTMKGVEHFVMLEQLMCDYNRIKTLDVSKNTKLFNLTCQFNEMTKLTLPNSKSLSRLDCSFNSLTASLDLSKHTNLVTLYCSNNKLTKVNVTNNALLYDFWCANNRMTSLDVSKNTELKRFNCGGNLLTKLDVSKNTKLTYLDFGNGGVWDSKILPDDYTAPSTYKNNIKSINLSANLLLEEVYGNSNANLASITLPKSNALKTLSLSGDKLSAINLLATPALESLDVSNNPLTSIDVSALTSLKHFWCSGCKLKSLDVTNNTGLKTLHCSKNNLTALDLSKNRGISDFECVENTFEIGSGVSSYLLDMLKPYGFDSSNASNWVNASYEPADNRLVEITGDVTYTYNLGNGATAEFKLLRTGKSTCPEVTSITPVSAVEYTNTLVTVRGKNFTKPVKLYLDGEEKTLSSISSSTLKFKTGDGLPAGKYDIVVEINGLRIELKESFTVTPRPARPKNLTAVAGDRLVKLTWDALPAGEADSYSVVITRAGKYWRTIKVGNVTEYTVKSLVNGTEYGFAMKSSLNRVESNEPEDSEYVFATPFKIVPPPISGLTAEPGNNKVILTWDPVPGAVSYRVCTYYENGKLKSYGKATTDTTFTVTSLTNGKKYGFYVQVNMVDGGKFPTAPNAADVTLVYCTPFKKVVVLDSPVITSAVGGERTIELAWDSVDGAESYTIYYYKNGSKSAAKKTCPATPTTYTLTGLTNGADYGIWIQAICSEGKSPVAAEDEYVHAKPIHIEPPKPAPVPTSDITLTPGKNTVTVEWQPVDGAKAYKVVTYELDKERPKSYNNITVKGNETSFSASVSSLKSGKKYGFLILVSMTGNFDDAPDRSDTALVYEIAL